jgi:hypothetical protein
LRTLTASHADFSACQRGAEHGNAARGVASAIATLAALLLTIAVLASAPGNGFSAAPGSRIAFLTESDAAAPASAAHSITPGSVAPEPRDATHCSRAQLSLRSTVMLQHTALPPPAQA